MSRLATSQSCSTRKPLSSPSLATSIRRTVDPAQPMAASTAGFPYRKRTIRRQPSLNSSTMFAAASDLFPLVSTERQNSAGAMRKRSGRLICSICEGPAHGYNFDAITCESCKAFFRRNALKTDVRRRDAYRWASN